MSLKPPLPTPVIVRAFDITPTPVIFLWQGRVPLGKLTLLEGNPGLGKSLVTIDLAARVSTGRAMPDGSPGIKAGVLILSAEDGPADTIRPRLEVAGADLERVHLFTAMSELDGNERLAEFPTDIEVVRRLIKEHEVRLVVVDPLVAYLAAQVDCYKDQEVRRALFPLAKLAEEEDVAVIAIRHLAKTPGRSAIYRGGGSIGIVGAARSALLVANDPDNETQRVLAVVKSNVAAPAPSLSYRIESAANGVARIAWSGESRHTADSLVAEIDSGWVPTALENAKDFLISELGASARAERDVEDKARNYGITDRTLKRARHELGVISRRVGGFSSDGYWVLELPKEANGVAKDHGPVTNSGTEDSGEEGG